MKTVASAACLIQGHERRNKTNPLCQPPLRLNK